MAKPLDSFGIYKQSKDGKLSKCKECKRKYDKEYYLKTINKRRSKKRITQKAITDRNSQFTWNYLKKNPCIDCAEPNPVVLEFDHREPKNKVDSVSNLSRSHCSITRLSLEIKKCDVRCANCHRIKTAKQFGWYPRIKK